MRALIAALCAARAATLRPLRPLQSPRDASLRALASDDLCERLKERVDLCSHVPEGLELLPLLGDGVGGLPDGTRLGAVAAPTDYFVSSSAGLLGGSVPEPCPLGTALSDRCGFFREGSLVSMKVTVLRL